MLPHLLLLLHSGVEQCRQLMPSLQTKVHSPHPIPCTATLPLVHHFTDLIDQLTNQDYYYYCCFFLFVNGAGQRTASGEGAGEGAATRIRRART